LPNPNNGNFKISLNNPQNISEIEILNTQGKVFKNFSITTTTNEIETILNISGIYFVRRTLESGEIIIRKMIVY